MTTAIVYGSKSYALLVAQIASELGFQIEGFLDDFGGEGLGSYAANRDRIIANKNPVLLGIGYSNLPARLGLLEKLLSDGVNLPNLIHPRAFVSPAAKLGVGNVVMAMSSIDAFSEIGNGNVFWPGATISHDNKIGDNNFFSPNSVACGFVKFGSGIFVGANATIIESGTVESGAFIKAGRIYKSPNPLGGV